MRLEDMKNNIPETPEFIHLMIQDEVKKQLQDTKVINIPDSGSEDVPAMSEIKGIDLVTEGLLTLQKLMEYYEDFSEDRLYFNRLIKKKDGAAELFRILFTEATEINFFFGNALNENYTALHIDREKKKELALELIDNLEAEGKKVKICFWCV